VRSEKSLFQILSSHFCNPKGGAIFGLGKRLSGLNIFSYYTLYALLVFTPLARGAVQDWAVMLIHLLTLTSLTAFLSDRALTRNWQRIRTPLDKPILFLIILAGLSSFVSVHPRSSLWAMVLLVNYAAVFYLTIHNVNTRSRLRHLIYLIIGMAVFLSALGLFKRFGINPFTWWDYGDLNSVNVRATYKNYNHLAGYIEMSLPLMLGLILTGFAQIILLLTAYLTFIMLAALILSLSRGGWISSFLSLSFMTFVLLTDRHFKSKGLLLVLVSGVLLVMFIILGSTPVVERILTVTEKDEEASLNSRMTAWKGIMEMISDYPVLGTGPGTFALAFTKYQPPGLNSRFTMAHNDYLQFVSELGLPFIAILIWMTAALYRAGFRKLENPSRLVRGTTLGAISGITAIFFHSAVDFNLHIPANALLFSVLAGIVVAPLPVSRRYGRKERPASRNWEPLLIQTDDLRQVRKLPPLIRRQG